MLGQLLVLLGLFDRPVGAESSTVQRPRGFVRLLAGQQISLVISAVTLVGLQTCIANYAAPFGNLSPKPACERVRAAANNLKALLVQLGD